MEDNQLYLLLNYKSKITKYTFINNKSIRLSLFFFDHSLSLHTHISTKTDITLKPWSLRLPLYQTDGKPYTLLLFSNYVFAKRSPLYVLPPHIPLCQFYNKLKFCPYTYIIDIKKYRFVRFPKYVILTSPLVDLVLLYDFCPQNKSNPEFPELDQYRKLDEYYKWEWVELTI